jgi:uncharacterized protein YjiS (DUF1127 family)
MLRQQSRPDCNPATGSPAMPAVPLPSSASPARLPTGPSLPRLWLHRIRHRRVLKALHPDQIRDAGLDPWILRAEIRKPFWRA